MWGYNARSFVLRQAGLKELCRFAAAVFAVKVALIDGSVDTVHAALADCRIQKLGDSQSIPAADHAIFLAHPCLAAFTPMR